MTQLINCSSAINSPSMSTSRLAAEQMQEGRQLGFCVDFQPGSGWADARLHATYFLCPLPGWQWVSGLSQELSVLLQLDHLHELGQDAGAPVQAHKLGEQGLQNVGSTQLLGAQLKARLFTVSGANTPVGGSALLRYNPSTDGHILLQGRTKQSAPETHLGSPE